MFRMKNPGTKLDTLAQLEHDDGKLANWYKGEAWFELKREYAAWREAELEKRGAVKRWCWRARHMEGEWMEDLGYMSAVVRLEGFWGL